MQKNNKLRLIPALLAVAFSGVASASGFQLLEQNGSGLGNAYAGSAAVAENASTIFYNPAGMTELKDREFSLGGNAIRTSFKFSNGGSIAPGLSGDGGDGGGWGFVPNAYLSWALTKDWYVGLGIGAPFGLKTQYDSPWVGAAQSEKFDLKTYNINPSIAWRANDWLSLGAGLNWQKVDAEYVRTVGTNGVPGVPVGLLPNSTATLNLDDSAWGWNIGALFKPAEQTKVGVSYRSKIKYETTGNVSISGPSPAFNVSRSSGTNAEIDMPDTFILSVVQGIGDKWELLGDVSWTGWSSIPQVDIYRSSGAPLQTLGTHFNDTWRFAIGTNYKIDDSLKLRFGIAYDQTPVPSAEHRLTSLPDNDRTWFSTGVQWKPNKTSALDAGIAYLYVKDASIDNNQLAQGRGYVKGTYSDSAWILGAQYSMSF
jgi:long-chain fatty acid transport protein